MAFSLMVAYLVISALLIPINLWAAITPHLHTDLSMRILHGVSSAALVPMLVSIPREWRSLKPSIALITAIFFVVMLVVNIWITANGMGVAYGWLDHVLLSCASASALVFFLLKPDRESSVSETSHATHESTT